VLISYTRPFFFIHIDKAAGTSIQDALRPFADPVQKCRLRRRLTWLGGVNRVFGIYREIEFPEHCHALTIKNCLPASVYDRMFKFAFVRNPWDRLVSRYAYLLRVEKHSRHEFVKKMSGFEEYVEWEIRRGKMHQWEYVCDRQGKLVVDFIGYFENLQEDFAVVCKRLGVDAHLPQANASKHRDYREQYTSALRERVLRAFARDIELFGYEFDGRRA
jgi:hypothetical protein